MDMNTTFGVIVSTRGFFPSSHAVEGRKKILAKLDKMGYQYVITPANATPNGAIETYSDAQKCAKLFSKNRDKIDGILVILPNFSDEQGVVGAIDGAKLNVPVMVQACDDTVSKLDLKNRRDSFCGKLSVCNNLYQRGIKFTNTTLHSCPIDSKQFTEDIDYFAKVCRVAKGVSTARIGMIGTRPDSFHTVRFSEKLLQASGVTVSVVDLSEIIAAATKLPESSKKVIERIKEIRAYGKIPKSIPAENIAKSARLALTVEDWAKENNCDATAIQCWSSIQQNYGCATCLTMSMMGEKGKPSACEADVTGALSMYALYLASGEPSGFLDWNNNYGGDRDMCICTHCSNYPRSFIGRKPEISNLDIIGASLGAEKCFGGIKANVAPGAMTFAKISTDDTTGRIKAYVGEGEFTDDPAQMHGGIAVCRIPELQTMMDYICTNGFEHHVAMNRSNSAKIIEEALGKYLGWDLYRHQK